jgi:rhamnopyranosyl-N-acetylglucosaminyl-diphospho-decaprenol beta-1,3/1,4-galactofuranosyltransferase
MSESKPERIAAIVVTYNRKQLLGECVDSLLRQTHPPDALYVIDNCSTDGTCEFLVEKGLISPVECGGNQPVETVCRKIRNPQSAIRNQAVSAIEVHYVRLPENAGGAGGFAEGMQRAVGAGFTWLCPTHWRRLCRERRAWRRAGTGPSS